MTDIVKRLRAPAYWFSGSDEGHEGENNAPYEAAARIEQLEEAWRVSLVEQGQKISQQAARIERLEAALREIAKTTYGYEPFMTNEEAAEYFSSLFFGAQAKARAALEERT